MYGKLFASTYTGSMAGAGADVFAVWGYVIAHTVDASVELNPTIVAGAIGSTKDAVVRAIDYLCAPDPDSRNVDHDGRRLIREGQFQYHVVSHERYRNLRNEAERRAYNREKQKAYRDRQKIQKTLPGNAVTVTVTPQAVSSEEHVTDNVDSHSEISEASGGSSDYLDLDLLPRPCTKAKNASVSVSSSDLDLTRAHGEHSTSRYQETNPVQQPHHEMPRPDTGWYSGGVQTGRDGFTPVPGLQTPENGKEEAKAADVSSSIHDRARKYIAEPFQGSLLFGPAETWPEVVDLNDGLRKIFPGAGKLRPRDARAAKIIERLADGYSPAELLEAARGAKLDPFISNNAKFQSVSVIWRDAEQVDRLTALARNPPTKPDSKPDKDWPDPASLELRAEIAAGKYGKKIRQRLELGQLDAPLARRLIRERDAEIREIAEERGVR